MFIVSISYQNVNKRMGGNRNGDEHYITLPTHTHIYIYPPRPDLERDCTRPGQGLYVCLSNLQAIVTLLQFSDSPLPTPFFFHQNPSPPHLQLRFCSSLFFAAPTSSSFTPPPPSPLPPFAPALSRQHERRACAYPFLEQTLPVPFSPRPDFASTRKLFTFSSPPPSLLCHGCERVTYSVWKQPAKDFPGWVSRGTSYGGVG